MEDTIYALSSGTPPAAIGVIRISGGAAGTALAALAGRLPPPRSPRLRVLKTREAGELDRALVIWFPGSRTATGEDLAEIHCHGGRAVVGAILAALQAIPHLREAEPGEFTRRAFANGRIDLAEAEGLADLLAAETEMQRRGAMIAAGGQVSRRIEEWRDRVLMFAAQVEAVVDFADEDDVADLPPGFSREIGVLAEEILAIGARPSADRLREGVRVIFAGPPNAGKSSLFNALLEENAAIVSAEEGTTRDVIERPVAIGGVPFVLVDTAGLRGAGAGEVETIGIARAREQIERADVVVWLGSPEQSPPGALTVRSKGDLEGAEGAEELIVSAVTGIGLSELADQLIARARSLLPAGDRIAFNRRQKRLAEDAARSLSAASRGGDLLIVAENLRAGRRALDRIIGRDSTEEMLDALFGRFCIGK